MGIFRLHLSSGGWPGPGAVAVMAEIKRASPSEGDINVDLDVAAMADKYVAGGASAISDRALPQPLLLLTFTCLSYKGGKGEGP
jgi:hypothetical protein